VGRPPGQGKERRGEGKRGLERGREGKGKEREKEDCLYQ